MHAEVGDRLVIRGYTGGQPDRDAEILEVRGPDGTAPFVVRWDDTGHETLFFPGPDAVVESLAMVESDGPSQAVLIGETVRSQHRRLFADVDRLLRAADLLDDASTTLPDEVHAAYDFLQHEVMPHAMAEDTELYPAVAELLGAPDATAPMTRQHVEIGRLADRLGRIRDQAMTHGLDDATRRTLRQVLYGLHAILTVHLATEEELYVPLLERRLSPKQSARLASQFEHGNYHGSGVLARP